MIRFISWFLGISVVLFIMGKISREMERDEEEFSAHCDAESFWHWLSGVMGEYAGLRAYINDRRTFGNDVWENGMTEYSSRLSQKLRQPSDARAYADCSLAISEIHRLLNELVNQFKDGKRQGSAQKSDMIGIILSNIYETGEKKRILLLHG